MHVVHRADELLGGYSLFEQLPRIFKLHFVSMVFSSIAPILEPLFYRISKKISLHPKYVGFLRYNKNYLGSYLLKRGLFLPPEFRSHWFSEFDIRKIIKSMEPLNFIKNNIADISKNNFSRIATLESEIYMRNCLLRDTDWASMAHSVEVRVPYVDSSVLRELSPFSGRKKLFRGKKILGELPSKPIPLDCMQRKKTGFNIPIEEWTKETIQNSNDLQFSRKWAHYIKNEFI